MIHAVKYQEICERFPRTWCLVIHETFWLRMSLLELVVVLPFI